MAAPLPGRPPTFDVLTEDALREGRSLKWSRYGPAIGAFVAEMDFGTAPAVTRRLLDTVERGQLGYATPEAAEEMARACAGWLARRYGWEVPSSWITPLADVVAGLQAAIERFTPPGSPVVLPTPAYMPFLAVPASRSRAARCAPSRAGSASPPVPCRSPSRRRRHRSRARNGST